MKKDNSISKKINSWEEHKKSDSLAEKEFSSPSPEKSSEPLSKSIFQVASNSFAKFRFWGLVFVFLGYLFFKSLDIVYLIFTALIIALSMEGIILSFQKRLKHRGWAIAISYLVLTIFLLSGLVFLIPFLISQTSMVISWISSGIVQIKDFIVQNSWPDAINQISWLPEFLKNYLIENWGSFSWANLDFQSSVLSGLNTLLDSSAGYLKQFSSHLFSFIGGFFWIIANLLIIFTLAVFFSLEKNYLLHLVIRSSDGEKKQKIKEKVDRVYQKLSLWLKARVLLSLFVTITMYISFLLLNLFGITIPSIFSLSLIAGLLDIVPYLGPVFAVVPAMILALVHNGFWGMIIVGIVYVVIQWIQNNIITPLLMEKQLGVNPILILISALLGAVIMGFWGIVLSVPLAVIVGLFIDEKK